MISIEIIYLWVEILIRCLHVIAGIAWIGSSFYFIALDYSLKENNNLPSKAHGEAWQVHGGGFYHLVKYLVAPDNLIISNGQTTGINGIQKGAKLNFYYAVTPITTNSYLVKYEHTVTEVRTQQDLGDLPMSGGLHSGIIKDVFNPKL